MEKVILYGAGKKCREVLPLIAMRYDIAAIVDRSAAMQGKQVYGVPVISLEEYKARYADLKLVLALNIKNSKAVAETLSEQGISNCCGYGEVIGTDCRRRIISYSDPTQLEDVILFNVFENGQDIFYIDIGSNDPILNSVTKLLYDTLNARGINIEPQRYLYEITQRERPEDINLCFGVGSEEGEMELYIQGEEDEGISTLVSDNIKEDYYKNKTAVKVTTLEKICREHVGGRHISFLKIDVEGFEKQVLLGADFKKYRPEVVVMESTLPMTDIPCHEEWEYILTENGYHHVFSYGVNRYYVADECGTLDEKFIPMLDIMKKYRVFRVS